MDAVPASGGAAAEVRRGARLLLLDARRAALHLALFVVAASVLLAAGHVDVASGSASFWLMSGWGALAILDATTVAGRRLVAGSPEGHPAVPEAGGIVTTGSISSTVLLDYDHGTAAKTYEPTRFVRLLYRFSFQARFPYADNAAALEAARHRRTVAGLLTRYWFGENMVAQALDLRREPDGRYTFVTELVRGTAPRDARRAKATLRDLTERFLDAGLPVWQVAYFNPRATGNLIEREDGAYRIIDLESNLVSPFLPPGAIVRAVRNAQYPAFDDIDLPRLCAYLAAERAAIVATIGEGDTARLFEAVDAYAVAQSEWHSGERRIAARALRVAFRLVDVPSWVRGMRRMTSGGERLADGFIRDGIADWVEEGHLEAAEGERLRDALATPEVATVTANLGAHMAMSIPLRFPLGSLARFGWTIVARVRAEWAALRGRGSAKAAREVHTIPVALFGLIPGFGAGAYLLAKPLRANHALAVIAFDRLLRKTPAGFYGRLHLSALMTWFARPVVRRPSTRRWPVVLAAFARRRAGLVRPHWRLVGIVLLVNFAVLFAAGVLHNVYGMSFAFSELGLVNTMDALQLLAAGVLGILTFRLFWRCAWHGAPAGESAGIFLWGLTGVGLLGFAFDDFFGVHERAGGWVAGHIGVLPLLTNHTDDFITLGYAAVGLAVLAVFRHELAASRASSAVLVAGVFFAALMVAVDAYAPGPLGILEFPLQVTAVALLLLAQLMRYREVASAPAAVPALSGGRAAAPAGDAVEGRSAA